MVLIPGLSEYKGSPHAMHMFFLILTWTLGSILVRSPSYSESIVVYRPMPGGMYALCGHVGLLPINSNKPAHGWELSGNCLPFWFS